MKRNFLLLLLSILLFTCASNPDEPLTQIPLPTMPNEHFTWDKSGDEGVVLYRDIHSLLLIDSFPLDLPSEMDTGHEDDTIGIFLRKGKFLWITAANPGSYDQPAFFCAKQEEGKEYRVVQIGKSEELYGDCGTLETSYLESVGPYIVVHRLSNGSGYCGDFPRFFRLDGKEIETDSPELVCWSCDGSAESDEALCMLSVHAIGFQKSRLTIRHQQKWMKETDRKIFETREFTVRYRVTDDKLTVTDTVDMRVTRQ